MPSLHENYKDSGGKDVNLKMCWGLTLKILEYSVSHSHVLLFFLFENNL